MNPENFIIGLYEWVEWETTRTLAKDGSTNHAERSWKWRRS